MQPTATGLKSPSIVRFDKIATLERSLILGKLGDAPPAWLEANRPSLHQIPNVQKAHP